MINIYTIFPPSNDVCNESEADIKSSWNKPKLKIHKPVLGITIHKSFVIQIFNMAAYSYMTRKSPESWVTEKTQKTKQKKQHESLK